MDEESLRAEVITFTAATLDGVSAFICPLLDNVAQHPGVRARLTAEIEAAEAAGRLSSPVATYDETTRLPYFMACISETLRRDAPAQTILPRVVSAGGYEVHGRHVPAGTHMGASPFIIHRDASVFGPDPEAFRPERWLEDEDEDETETGTGNRSEDGRRPDERNEKKEEKGGGEARGRVARMEKYGMWWGYGDRECAGRYYAQMEMQKLCLELLRRFDFESADPRRRFVHKRWAVGMFWEYRLVFRERRSE